MGVSIAKTLDEARKSRSYVAHERRLLLIQEGFSTALTCSSSDLISYIEKAEPVVTFPQMARLGKVTHDLT